MHVAAQSRGGPGQLWLPAALSAVAPRGLVVDLSLGGHRVLQTLGALALRGRLPRTIAVDNGTEFTPKVFDQSAYLNHVQFDFSPPGKPTDSALIESFHARLRAEFLNENWFLSLEDASEKIEAWRLRYNAERFQSALGNRSHLD